MGAVSQALSPPEVTQCRWRSPPQDGVMGNTPRCHEAMVMELIPR